MKKLILLFALLSLSMQAQEDEHYGNIIAKGLPSTTTVDTLIVQDTLGRFQRLPYTDLLIKLGNDLSTGGGSTYTFNTPLSESLSVVSIDLSDYARLSDIGGFQNFSSQTDFNNNVVFSNIGTVDFEKTANFMATASFEFDLVYNKTVAEIDAYTGKNLVNADWVNQKISDGFTGETAIGKYNEGNGYGFYPVGIDRASYGNIGYGAFDLSGVNVKTNLGSRGTYSFTMGIDNISTGYASITTGYSNENNGNYNLMGGIGNISGGGGTLLWGVGLRGQGGDNMVLFGSANIPPTGNPYNFLIGNGSITVDANGVYNPLVQSDSFRGYRSGRIEAPSFDLGLYGSDKDLTTVEKVNLMIGASGGGVSYLPLTAGASYPLTGSLYGGNDDVRAYTGGNIFSTIFHEYLSFPYKRVTDGGGTSNISGVIIGKEAGEFSTSSDITAIGYRAVKYGNGGIGIGSSALYQTTGADNIGIGDGAGSNSTGGANLFIGDNAGSDSASSTSVFIGNSSGDDSRGYSNSFIGLSSGKYNLGNNNIGVGSYSLGGNSGDYNSGLGYNSVNNYTYGNSDQRITITDIEQNGDYIKYLPNLGTVNIGEDYLMYIMTISDGFYTNTYYPIKILTDSTLMSYKYISDRASISPTLLIARKVHRSTSIGYNSNALKSDQVILGSSAIAHVSVGNPYLIPQDAGDVITVYSSTKTNNARHETISVTDATVNTSQYESGKRISLETGVTTVRLYYFFNQGSGFTNTYYNNTSSPIPITYSGNENSVEYGQNAPDIPPNSLIQITRVDNTFLHSIRYFNNDSVDGTVLRNSDTAPSTSSSSGTKGDIRFDSSYVYICTATDTWVRAPLTTW